MLARQGATRLLVDVTRHFSAQAGDVDRIDAILLTHAHRDAAGGLAQLRAWCRARDAPPVPLFASAATHRALRARFARLEHVRPLAVAEGERHACGPWSFEAIEVPHARDPATPTFAWRLVAGDAVIVYASDVARLTARLERFADGAGLLVVDGAMWRRTLFTHLTIDAALPKLCRWRVGRIALTQIGRTAPPHEQLEREARARCPRAFPAYDGLTLRVRS